MNRPRKILLTGGSGFIGGYLSKLLLEAGYSVFVAPRSSISGGGLKSLDLSRRTDVIDFVERVGPFDVIIHCAAIAHGQRPPGEESVAKYNSMMVANLVDAFRRNQPHWIFISSVSVYGPTTNEAPVTILPKPVPIDDYGRGKLNDENLLIKVCDKLDILRLAPTYDSHHTADIEKRVFFPKTSLKLRIVPPPYYTLCAVTVVGDAVVECLQSSDGKNLHHVGDARPTSQRLLEAQFSGATIVIPQALFRFLISIMPSKVYGFYLIRAGLKKLGLNNIYDIGSTKISN